ncbi:DUF2381 family protein [Archangium violaceum]|uniref:DUF2381 family protein n=1 Tax=Archangium violaceum TaxID=83451 RepID=UPI002B3093B7|nr:DUF2381 family protein [Archangium gephyra]
MTPASRTGLLLLALVAGNAGAAENTPRAPCEMGDLRIELTAGPPSEPPVLCTSPELTTTLLFDTKLLRVELEGRERFHRVMEDTHGLTLVPSGAMLGEEPLRLTVYFADGAGPASASFLMMVHPALTARQVDVLRHTRPIALYELAERKAQTTAQRCEEEKTRLRAELDSPGGIRGLRSAGLVDQSQGVRVHDITASIKQKPGSVLHISSIWAYRSHRRIAVEMLLHNQSTTPWTAMDALLRCERGEELRPLPLSPTAPILPGQIDVSTMVEMDATIESAKGSCTLTLWGTDGRFITLGNVTFP